MLFLIPPTVHPPIIKNGSEQSPIVDIKTVFFFRGFAIATGHVEITYKRRFDWEKYEQNGLFFSNFCLIPGRYIPLYNYSIEIPVINIPLHNINNYKVL